MTGDGKKEEAEGPKEKDAGKPPDKLAAYEARLDATSDRIRETAKWIVGTFGAVAAALLVGLQLSDIGKLEGSDHVVAGVAVFGALVAVIMIITLASTVLARGSVPMSELSSTGGRKYKRLVATLERNHSLYGSYGSVTNLVDTVEEQWDKQTRSWNEKMTSSDPAVRAKAEKEFLETKKVMPELNELNRRLMAAAKAEDVRLSFGVVRNWILVFAIAVAAGGAAFALVDNAPAEEEEAAVAQSPVAATVHLTKLGEEKMADSLGEKCDLSRVPVVVLSTSEDGWEVVSEPAAGCKTARLSVEPEDGEVSAAESVDLEFPVGQ